METPETFGLVMHSGGIDMEDWHETSSLLRLKYFTSSANDIDM